MTINIVSAHKKNISEGRLQVDEEFGYYIVNLKQKVPSLRNAYELSSLYELPVGRVPLVLRHLQNSSGTCFRTTIYLYKPVTQ